MEAPETPSASRAPAGVGVLRWLLAVVVAACVALAPFASGEPHGWRVVAVYVAPVMAVLTFWVLLFDLLMGRVLLGDQPPEGREHYRRVLRFDGVLTALLVLAWAPFLLRLATT
jgi:hypothetical protein